jgi:RNA polymerase sigma-54 factor
MGLGPRLDLRQSQQLVMTPQLQQAIKLLTLTNIELESFVVGEIEKNPLLEIGGPEGGAGDAAAEQSGEGASSVQDAYVATDTAFSDNRPTASDAPLDIDMGEAVFHHDAVSDRVEAPTDAGSWSEGLSLSGAGSIANGGAPDDLGDLDATAAPDQSLHEHLQAQAGATFASDEELFVARYIIDLIDEAGYLTDSCSAIAERLGLSPFLIEHVLKVVQTFDPTGVGARSLGECLKLQAREANRLDPAMEALLDNLELLARGDVPALRRLCRVDQEDMADMIREVRSYNPKPGLLWGGGPVHTVVPDIFVRKNPAGSWQVELNSSTLPRVLVNRAYHAQLSAKSSQRDDKLFLSDCLSSANWLVKALDQRARTILKVASEIVRQQEDFFDKGVRYLRPLNLRTIAEAISMHESTVSRVTTAKYLSSSRGVFELKYFFTSAIQAADGGDSLSAEAVKSRIKALIDAESPKAILSDDDLVKLLSDEQIDIARRTIAKYREAMHIPSSVQRRRLKALGRGPASIAAQ